MLFTAFTVAGQPPPPGGPQGVKQRLADVKPAGETARSILAMAKVYLERSERFRNGSPFARSRFLATADALVHAAEHQQHLERNDLPGEKGPAADRNEIARHVERVYFRLQQADYFVEKSADVNAETIAGFARQYYQAALRALDGGEFRIAGECAKSCEDLIRALENLALSTAPPPPPPPPPPLPPRPEPGSGKP